jgi:hypothetical protein
MALVRRNAQNAALAGVVWGIVNRYGRRLTNEAMDMLNNAVYDGVEQGERALNQYMANWIQRFGNDLGNEALSIAQNVRDAVQGAQQQIQQALGNNREVAIDENGDIPDLSELIPENTMSGTARPAAGQPGGEAEAQRIASSGAGGNSSVSKETPISRYPTLTYGLQETHTTILPWCGYISTTGMNYATPNVLEIRMTQPHDMIKTTIQGLADGATWGKDFYNAPYNNSNNKDTATSITFPATMSTGAAVNERPTYWEFYRQMYEYYTVLGCEYEIYLDNPNSERGTDILVGWDYNAYSATAGATGNITPQDQTLNVMKQYKGVQWRTIEQSAVQDNDKRQTIIKGTYHAGDARRNVANDNEVRTWHKTNNGGVAEAVNLIELLTLYFYRHELAWLKPATKTLGVNMQIKLKYIVQFKDLLRPFRYPNTVDTGIDVIGSADIQQFPL